MGSEMTMNHHKVRPSPFLAFGLQGSYGGLAEAVNSY